MLTPGVSERWIAGAEVDGRDAERVKTGHVGPAKLRARRPAHRGDERGRDGLVLGYLGVIIPLLLLVLAVASSHR